MDRISKFIVRYRNKILLVAVLLLIPSVIGYLNTGINYDILSYLPKEAESMKGQEVLDKDFNLASVGMMVTNDLSDKEVVSLKDKIEKIDGVKKVFWRDDVLDITFPKEMIPEALQKQLYSKDSTLMIVTFEEDTASEKTMDAIAKIKEVSNKDCYLGGMSAIAQDTKDLANSETVKYAVIAVLLSLVVLYLGLESSVAPLIFMLGMAFPIIYNFGTNIFLGKISYITQALAMILQLAVTMDYSIFLLHRYQEEKKKAENTIQLFHRLVEDYNISEPVREKMEVWFRYKMERKESYKEQGMKSLLKKTENNEGSYGANEICNLIEDCMANNWKGIIWKILEERKQQRPATRTEQIQQRVSEVDSW